MADLLDGSQSVTHDHRHGEVIEVAIAHWAGEGTLWNTSDSRIGRVMRRLLTPRGKREAERMRIREILRPGCDREDSAACRVNGHVPWLD